MINASNFIQQGFFKTKKLNVSWNWKNEAVLESDNQLKYKII